MTRQCTISMLEESGSWELVRLRGKPEGCPSGRDLLELHEQIGRQIGARSSTLIDGSEYELYRGNEDMVLRVRSTLFNVLFKSDSTELESFYSKFG